MPTGENSPASKRQSAEHKPASSRLRETQPDPPLDRLRPAGWLLATSVALAVSVIALLIFDTVRARFPHQGMMISIYRAIGLNEIALTPSGRQARRPSPLPMATDGRYLPSLPNRDPGIVPPLDTLQMPSSQAVNP